MCIVFRGVYLGSVEYIFFFEPIENDQILKHDIQRYEKHEATYNNSIAFCKQRSDQQCQGYKKFKKSQANRYY